MQTSEVVVGVFLFVAFATGVVGGGSIADSTDFAAWLNEWQELAAGLLGIVGGALAVFAALMIDTKQEERHREAMALTLLPDALRVWRAADPFARLLKDWSRDTAAKWTAIGLEGPTHGGVDDFISQAEMLSDILSKSSDLDKAHDLLPPRTAFDLEQVRRLADHVLPVIEQIEARSKKALEYGRIVSDLDRMGPETAKHWAINMYEIPLDSMRSFAENFPSDACGTIQNQAALPDLLDRSVQLASKLENLLARYEPSLRFMGGVHDHAGRTTANNLPRHQS